MDRGPNLWRASQALADRVCDGSHALAELSLQDLAGAAELVAHARGWHGLKRSMRATMRLDTHPGATKRANVVPRHQQGLGHPPLLVPSDGRPACFRDRVQESLEIELPF